jgi:hypothetical protein
MALHYAKTIWSLHVAKHMEVITITIWSLHVAKHMEVTTNEQLGDFTKMLPRHPRPLLWEYPHPMALPYTKTIRSLNIPLHMEKFFDKRFEGVWW